MRPQSFLSAGAFVLVAGSSPVAAQFGVANNKRHVQQQREDQLLQQQVQEGTDSFSGSSAMLLEDMMNDQEIREAVEFLAGMGAEEMAETMQEVAAMLGDGDEADPETAAALREAMAEVSKMSAEDIRASLGKMAAPSEDMLSDSISEALRMLADADQGVLDTVLERKDLILEAVVQSGEMTEADAEKFRKNPAEWEDELKGIWGELKRQAEGSI